MIDSKYRWQLANQPDPAAVTAVAGATGLPEDLAKILVTRGIDQPDQAQEWLQPDPTKLTPPGALHDIDRAKARIERALEAGEQITVYGDYDADGITATALLYEALATMGAQVDYYVPDRFKDGYGPNPAVYQRLIENGTRLIVTVDNGVTGSAAVQVAKRAGVDVVITDHHALPKELPAAAAIVHPHYPGAVAPAADYSGVGVAFMLAWALLGEFPVEMLDLVAIGEIADLVKLTGDNHTLVALGLAQLRRGERPGLHALAQRVQLAEAHLTDQDVAFQLAPRLNALGRVATAGPGVDLLTTFDPARAEELAARVDQANDRRKELVAEITKKARQMALAPAHHDQPALVLVGEGWHQGVLGIVAAHLAAELGKPTIIAAHAPGEAEAKGSGRSVDGLDLFAALDGHRDLMTAFGGHAMACGMSFQVDQAAALEKVLATALVDQGVDREQKPALAVDLTVDPTTLTPEFYAALQKLGPFGPGNPQPVLRLKDVSLGRVQCMGKENQHLKFGVGQPAVTVLAFGRADLAPELQSGTKVTLAATMDLNRWRGTTRVQLLFKDLQQSGIVVLDQRTRRLTPTMFTTPGVYLVFNPRLRENVAGNANGPVIAPADLAQTDTAGRSLVIVDCPPAIDRLTSLLQKSGAGEVRFLCFSSRPPVSGMPSRAAFTALYRILQDHPKMALAREQGSLSRDLRLPLDQLIFMINVFFEAGFVTIEDGVLTLVQAPTPRDLKTTTTYRKYQARFQVDRVLLMSSPATLVTWTNQLLTAPKGESE